MWTGLRLYQEEKITAEQLATAICSLVNQQKRLGRIALEKRYLTVAQVMDVLAEQAASPSRKFGELAISLGYLTEDKLKQLLGEQALVSQSLSDLLLELGYVSEKELHATNLEQSGCPIGY